MVEEAGAKEKILETVVTLLKDGQDASKVSNRQIAALAGVNSALINYYYQTKENLIGIAAGICIENIAGELQQYDKNLHPADQIKFVLKKFAGFCLNNEMIVEVAIRFNSELKHGSTYTSGMLLPILREHFGESKKDLELKLIAFQLLNPMQAIFSCRNEYRSYLSCDLSRQDSWDFIIETLVNNVFEK